MLVKIKLNNLLNQLDKTKQILKTISSQTSEKLFLIECELLLTFKIT